jgi:hypothetical protein
MFNIKIYENFVNESPKMPNLHQLTSQSSDVPAKSSNAKPLTVDEKAMRARLEADVKRMYPNFSIRHTPDGQSGVAIDNNVIYASDHYEAFNAFLFGLVMAKMQERGAPKNDLMSALNKAGIEVTRGMNVELKDPTGKTKIVSVNSDGNVTTNEGLKDKLIIGATCFTLASGLISCTKPKDSNLRPNDTKIEMTSGEEQNAEPVDFLNVDGETVTMDNITSGLAKWTPKPIKGDTNQYKQPTMKPNVRRIEVRPDSVVANNNTPWIGYWKFTDECRSNNQQVMIWSQVGDNPLDGIIYSGYQVGPEYADWSHYQLIGGKGYFLSAYKISSFNYDKTNNRVTVYMSAPDVDKGATRKLEIDFNGNQMNIINWGGGRAVRVGGMGDFKW